MEKYNTKIKKCIIDTIPLEILRIIWGYSRLTYLIKPGLSTTNKYIYKSILSFLTVDDLAAMLLYRASYNKKIQIYPYQIFEDKFQSIFDINDLWKEIRLFFCSSDMMLTFFPSLSQSKRINSIIMNVCFDELFKIKNNPYKSCYKHFGVSNSRSLCNILCILNGCSSIMLESWNYRDSNSKKLEKIGRMFVEISNLFLNINGLSKRFEVTSVSYCDEENDEREDDTFEEIISINIKSYNEKTEHRSYFHELAELLLTKLRSHKL